MKYGTMGVLVQEKNFAQKLIRLAAERKQIPFDIHLFTDPVHLLCSMEDLSVLLISETLYERLSDKVTNKLCIVLSEQRNIRVIDGCPAIFRYQSGLKIWEAVLNLCASYFSNVTENGYGMQHTQLIGVYSPLQFEDRFLFSVKLAKILSEKKRVLYLNLDSCCGFMELMCEEFDKNISDLFYFWKQKPGNFLLKLNSLTERLEELYLIPPARCEYDLEEIDAEDWIEFFHYLEKESGYDTIVIQFGEKIRHLPDVLTVCSVIYFPVRTGIFSKRAFYTTEQTFCHMKKEELVKKLKLVERHGEIENDLQTDELPGVWEKIIRDMQQEENNEGFSA